MHHHLGGWGPHGSQTERSAGRACLLKGALGDKDKPESFPEPLLSSKPSPCTDDVFLQGQSQVCTALFFVPRIQLSCSSFAGQGGQVPRSHNRKTHFLPQQRPGASPQMRRRFKRLLELSAHAAGRHR